MNELNYRVYSEDGFLVGMTVERQDAASLIVHYNAGATVRMSRDPRSTVFTITDDNYKDAQDWRWVASEILAGKRALKL
jgi:hypothetical protein